jgi:hypothetical protein
LLNRGKFKDHLRGKDLNLRPPGYEFHCLLSAGVHSVVKCAAFHLLTDLSDQARPPLFSAVAVKLAVKSHALAAARPASPLRRSALFVTQCARHRWGKDARALGLSLTFTPPLPGIRWKVNIFIPRKALLAYMNVYKRFEYVPALPPEQTKAKLPPKSHMSKHGRPIK